MNRAFSLLEIKAVDEDKRVITGIATTPTVDRVGDIVEPKGAEFKLPVPLLWQHDAARPIGHVVRAKVTKSGIEITAKIERESEPGDLKNLLDFAWQSIKKGLVRGLSIGFKSLEHSRRDDDDGFGLRYIRWLWLELSAVTIPANEEATITAVKNFDAEALAASGRVRKTSNVGPGVTGRRSSNSQTKGTTKMKTVEQLLRELEEVRAEKAARMEEIAPDEDGNFEDEDTKKEYRGLVKELKELDEKICDQEGILLARKTAKPVIAKNVREASKSRAGENVVKELPKGTAFTRYVMAMAATKGAPGEAMMFAKKWSDTPEVVDYIKAMHLGIKAQDVGQLGGDSVESPDSWGYHLGYKPNLAAEFVELLYPATLIGRMQGFRRIPFNVRVGIQDGGSTVNWVGEAAAKPVTGLNFDEVLFTVSKIAGIIVLTDELVRLSTPSAEATVRTDLVRAIAKFMDEQMLDTSITANTSRPASLTNGVSAISASGYDATALRVDFNSALAGYDNAETGIDNIYVLMTPATARGISTMMNALGQQEFPTLTPQGGSIFGFPVLVSNSVPDEAIVFVKTDEVWLADDGQVTIDASREATVDMAGGNTPAFSLWQKNCVGIRAERWVRWQKRRAAAVQLISGALYNPSGESPVG